MDVLVIGGSVFLGRAVVDEALASGATVTVFNRGRSGPVVDGVRHIAGDRTVAADLDRLRGERFDLVVDTCGYVPAEVAQSASLLADRAGHYTFVSSINAYPGWPTDADYLAHGAHATADPDATRDDVPADLDEAAVYGWLKVGCELAVARAFGAQRSSVLRAGSIVGPHDSQIGRLPWWLDRFARGGEVLVPGTADSPVSLVDARDLARFALLGAAGVFDTPGPPDRDDRADLTAACLAATGSDATPSYVEDEQWLLDQGVGFWTELPLWIPAAVGPATWSYDSGAAVAAGLTWRPLRDTVRDTWAWMRAAGSSWQPASLDPRLDPAKEAELLARWHARR